MSRQPRILEFGAEEKVSLPIVKFPPFGLRAALVEKDPVVWVQLLETYVTHLQYLMAQGRIDKIDGTTHERLVVFVQAYLHEMAEEDGKVLSLGMNMEVQRQLAALRRMVLVVVRSCGLLHLQIFSDAMWNLVRVYVREYPDTVRGLIEGSLQPVINTQKASLNRVYQVQQYVQQRVEANRFTRGDLKALEDLLAARSRAANTFVLSFVNVQWVNILEGMYQNESNARLRTWARNLGVLSYLSASETRLEELLRELDVVSLQTLAVFPLLGSLLISAAFRERMPRLYIKVPFLALVDYDGVEEESPPVDPVAADKAALATVHELFPQVTEYQVAQLLLTHENNVELVINDLFEDPTLLDRIPAEEPTKPPLKVANNRSKKKELRLRDRIVRKQLAYSSNVPDEVRNKTLTQALRLLYENDGDERDDTYDEAETLHPTGERVQVEAAESPETSQYDRVEAHLWELLKKDKSLFTREQRGSANRRDLKQSTLWSDEQIEGWARMLERSPRRAQILEEKYMFAGNVRTGKKKFTQNSGDQPAQSTEEPAASPRSDSNSAGRKQAPPSKKQFAGNERNKRSRANHNRKAARGKKVSRGSEPQP
ncbi:FAFL024Wp [Eremothecium gossypii FDAG1]|nr:FAFL024Wp [Eremothecium gossypii FDAG1]